ncbi:MAG: saccharopine dehydrogenase family protein [Actinomycetota bacterium]
MATILVLGGAGAMGSVAVRELHAFTDHDLVVADTRLDAVEALAAELGARVEARLVDVEDPVSLAAAMGGADAILNATLMRQVVAVTRAAIDAGVHLVDLGAYYPETREQLELDEPARVRGCRIVGGCGVAPRLTNVLARRASDLLDEVEAIRFSSYITHPMTTSPGIVYTRLDASVGSSLVLVDGRHEERPSFGEEAVVSFSEPYGPQAVHLVPHPEALTLPRTLKVQAVSFKVGYPSEETARIRALLQVGFNSAEPFAFGEARIVPRDLAAAYIGREGLPPDLPTANLKHVEVDGLRGGEPVTLVFDLVVERVGEPSASAALTGIVAAIAPDLVARGQTPGGVHAPEAALDPQAVLDSLAERDIHVLETERSRR